MRYAKALLAFSTERGEEDRVYKEMVTLADTYERVGELQRTLLNPTLSVQQRVELLESACGTTANLSESTSRFIRLIADKKRTDLMLFIAHSYLTIYHERKQIVRGRLVVPVEVSESICERMRAIIERLVHRSVEFEVRVEPEIEGGFILEYDTYRMDASLRSQLSSLRRALK